MTKRPLTDEERKAAQINKNRIEEDMKILKAQRRQAEYQLEEGIEIHMLVENKRFKKIRADLNNQLSVSEELLKTLKDQIRDGVEIKEKTVVEPEEEKEDATADN